MRNGSLISTDSCPCSEKISIVERRPPTCWAWCRSFFAARDLGWNKWTAKSLHLRLRNSKRDRFAYIIDRILAKRWRFFSALVIGGLIQVLLSACFYAIVWRYEPDLERRPHEEVHVFLESIWAAWTFMADPGTHSSDFRFGSRLVGSLITIGGIMYMAVVLGVTVDIVRDKMDSLRQGKSKVIEENHTLILGWTAKTIHIIEELCCANESEGGGVVVVMAPFEKATMEGDLELQLPHRQRCGTRIVFRRGSPLVMADLIRVSAHLARSIIVLASSGTADDADSDTLRTMLALQSLSELRGYAVAEIRDIDNEPLVRLAGGSIAETLVSHDVVGRLMLMSVRQPGLAKVYEALLGFEGDEFYFSEWPDLEGCCFGDLAERFPKAIPIGVRQVEGTTVLMPSISYSIGPGDEIIVIAEDNDTYTPQPPTDIDAGDPPPIADILRPRECILICGWRRDIRDILLQLDKMAGIGTEVHMMTHVVPIPMRNEKLMDDGLDVNELKNVKIIHWFGSTAVRRKLQELPMERFTSAMIFADQAFEDDSLRADSHSLATLLLIRDLQSSLPVTGDPIGLGEGSQSMSLTDSQSLSMINTLTSLENSLGLDEPALHCPIICEVLDPHTQRTISCSRQLSLASDFCQTNKLIAQVLAMIAEERTVNMIFAELLGYGGCDIAVVSNTRYCDSDEIVSFFAISKRAAGMGEVLIGYQQQRSIYKTVLNPPDKNSPRAWKNYDFAILRNEKESLESDEKAVSPSSSEDVSPRRSAMSRSSRMSQSPIRKKRSLGRSEIQMPTEMSMQAVKTSFSEKEKRDSAREANLDQGTLSPTSNGSFSSRRSKRISRAHMIFGKDVDTLVESSLRL